MGELLKNQRSTEYYEMVEKERLIGRQICIVRMLCTNEDSLLRKWYFMDAMANCLKISEEELKGIIEGRKQFDDNEICLDAALEFAKAKELDSYDVFQYFYVTYGKTYMRLLLFLDKNKLEIWLKEIEKIYIQNIFWEDEGDYIDFEFLKEAMEYYAEFYLEKINNLYENGFALAVIAEMARNVLDEEEIRCLMRKRGYQVL